MLLEKFLNETFSQSKYVKEIGGEERPFSRNLISADNLSAATGFMADLGEGEGQEIKEQRGFGKECLKKKVKAWINILAEVFFDNDNTLTCYVVFFIKMHRKVYPEPSVPTWILEINRGAGRSCLSTAMQQRRQKKKACSLLPYQLFHPSLSCCLCSAMSHSG